MSSLLLVEDDPDESHLFKLAYARAGLRFPLICLETALQAIAYLSSGNPKPLLGITDLNMPLMNGFELLSWLGEHRQQNAFPVIVLTASAHPGDRLKALSLGAVEFLTKPGDFDDLIQMLIGVNARWLNFTTQQKTGTHD